MARTVAVICKTSDDTHHVHVTPVTRTESLPLIQMNFIFRLSVAAQVSLSF